MSQRDYKLVVRLDIDKQSIRDMANKINEEMKKVFSKTVVSVPRGGGLGGDYRVVTLLTRLVNEMSSLNGKLSRFLQVRGRVGGSRVVASGRRGVGFRKVGEMLSGGTGVLAKGVAFGMAIFEMVKRIVSAASEFSGYFKSSMKLLETVVGLFLKPILDFIGLLLRPFLILMLPVAIALNKMLAPVLAKVAKGDFFTLLAMAISGVIGGAVGSVLGKAIGTAISGAVGRIAGATVGRVIGGAVGSIGGPVGTIVGALLGGLIADFIASVLDEEGRKKIVDALNAVGAFFGSVFSDFVKGIENRLKLFSMFFGLLFEKLGEVWNGMVGWFSDVFGGIGKTLGDAWDSFVRWVTENMGNIAGFIGESWDGFVKWVSDNLGKVGSLLGDAWNGFTSWISDNLGGIGKMLGGAWNSFVDWIKSNLGDIGKRLGDAWRGFVDWVLDKFGKIGEWIGSGWEKFVDFIKSIGKAVSDILIGAWEKIVDFFSKVGRMIGKLLAGDFVGALNELGSIFGVSESSVPRGQFGLDIMAAGRYFLEPGEIVLSRSDVMRLVSAISGSGGGTNVNVPITIYGPIYGVKDLESMIERVVYERVGNILYDVARRGVR